MMLYYMYLIPQSSFFKNGNSKSPIFPKLRIFVRIFSDYNRPKNKNIQPHRVRKTIFLSKKSVSCNIGRQAPILSKTNMSNVGRFGRKYSVEK